MKWFHHDTDTLRNRKIRKVIRTHGVTGYGIWFALLERLYESEGDFQILADDLWLEDLADDLKISDYRTLIRVFDTFAEVGLVSSQLWQGEHILYCEAIAERGDAYMKKRIKEAEKKRRQRAKNPPKKTPCPQGTNKGQGDKTQMSPPQISDRRSEIQKADLVPIEEINNLDLPPLIPPSQNSQSEQGEGENFEFDSVAVTANAIEPEARSPLPTQTTSHNPGITQNTPTGASIPLSRSGYEFGNKCQQADHVFGGQKFPWTGDDRFVEWLADNWKWNGESENRMLRIASRRDWLRRRERAWDVETIQGRWEAYQADKNGAGSAIAPEETQTAIGRELGRLNRTGQLPPEWQERTGVMTAKELSAQHAAEYLAYLRSQGGAA